MSHSASRMCSSNCHAEYGNPSGTRPRSLAGKLVNRRVKVGVRFVPVDYLRKLLTEDFIVAHGHPSLHVSGDCQTVMIAELSRADVQEPVANSGKSSCD